MSWLNPGLCFQKFFFFRPKFIAFKFFMTLSFSECRLGKVLSCWWLRKYLSIWGKKMIRPFFTVAKSIWHLYYFDWNKLATAAIFKTRVNCWRRWILDMNIGARLVTMWRDVEGKFESGDFVADWMWELQSEVWSLKSETSMHRSLLSRLLHTGHWTVHSTVLCQCCL